MDFKRISVALKRKKNSKKGEQSIALSRKALYGFADATGYESNGALYNEFDLCLEGDARYQFNLLAIGNKKFANLSPIRGTLNEEKLDYFTWRLHHLFVDQLDRDRLDTSRSESSLSSHSSGEESKNVPMATAMERMADLSISEPGWITMQNYRQMEQEDKRTSYRQAIVTNDALAAIPLLEREERHFVIAEEGQRDRRSNESDSLFDHFYDAKLQQKPVVVDVRDEGEEEKPLPPALLPASMFYRASFGIRQKPLRKTSSKSISSETEKMSKLRSLFKAPLLRRADSEGTHTSVYVK